MPTRPVATVRVLVRVILLIGTIFPVGCAAPFAIPASTPEVFSAPFAEPPPLPAPAQTDPVGEPAKTDPLRPGTLTLAQAIHECVLNNLRLKAGAEAVRQAEAELLGASLIPNPTFLPDAQLNPFTRFSPQRQGGPPQYDLNLLIPVDWLLYGKRFTAMAAARLGVAAAEADTADLTRTQVLATVIAFFDAIEARELLRLGRENLAEIETQAERLRKSVEAGTTERYEYERVSLAALEALRQVHQLEIDWARARAALRPLLGRLGPVEDVAGDLEAGEFGPDITTDTLMTLAEAHRPDLAAARLRVARADADVRAERRKAFPALGITPGFTYQSQENTIGFPDARSYNWFVTAELPAFDRNQDGIARARSLGRQRVWELHADTLDAHAEIEQLAESWRVSRRLVADDSPAIVAAARRYRDRTAEAFRLDKRGVLDLVDAQREYRERLSESISARANYWRSVHRLNAAVGVRVVPAVH